MLKHVVLWDDDSDMDRSGGAGAYGNVPLPYGNEDDGDDEYPLYDSYDDSHDYENYDGGLWLNVVERCCAGWLWELGLAVLPYLLRAWCAGTGHACMSEA